MADKRIAVAVIHGMGRQTRDAGGPPDRPSFSAGLLERVSTVLEPQRMAGVAWREIYWADILQERQDAYLARLDLGGWVNRKLRDFVMSRLSDAASYRFSHDPAHPIYSEIHARVTAVLKELRAEVGPGAPLVLVAHSLGGHILSNYIYDALQGEEPLPGDFLRMGSLRSLVTFGCNIPVFVVAYDPNDMETIAPPIARAHRPGDPPWWLNFWDPADPLGFPLAPLGGEYADLHASGQLVDHRIRAGWGIPGLAHNAYWTDRDVWQAVAAEIARLDPQ